MKLTNSLLTALCVLSVSSVVVADEIKTLNIGAAEISYDYQPTDTGVDLSLASNERMGIQAEALQVVDDDSLFTPMLGSKDTLKQQWQTVGENSAINLKQFHVNVLSETNLIETSESIDIVARFPVFQLNKPVSQWSYNFSLKDFKQAIQHIDQNCTPIKFMELIKQKT